VLAEETLDAVEIAMATLASADTPREVQAAAIALDRAGAREDGALSWPRSR
jgi:hypothetical protein